MSLLVTGSLGIDNVTTPHGSVTNVIGGSAIYFSWAAAAFSKVRLVAVVGEDFPTAFEAAFNHPNIDIAGLERRKGSKTFRWTGTYDPTMNEATTLEVDLNVLIEAPPKVPAQFMDSKVVFLAATHPNLQLDLLSQVKAPRLSIADTRDLWIKQFHHESLAAFKQFDGIVLNDLEARLLTGHVDLVAALRDLQKLVKPSGPRIVLLKKGEHGCIAATGDEIFALPAYPKGKVIDPTGAGDSFAGGLLGYLAATETFDLHTLKNAIAAGTVMASFTIEDFSLNRISKVGKAEIEQRLADYRKMLALEGGDALMKNLEVASIFERTADVLALLEENTFRILAYRKIARVLGDLAEDVAKLAEKGELENVPGIGKSSAERIEEYLRTGRVGEFEDLLSQVPAGVLQMIKIPSLGPKTAVILWREGGVTSMEELKKRIEAGTLKDLPGLGAKKLAKILENIAHLATSAGRIGIGKALPLALAMVEFLKGLPGVENATYCGSLRRGKETIGDIDLLVSAKKEFAAAVGEAVTKHDFAGSVIQVGESKTSIRTGNGVQVDVRVVPPESWGAALQYFTGSTAHNVRLRELAVKKGLKINEWGVFKNAKRETRNAKQGAEENAESARGFGERVAGETEEGVYAAVGMAWMAPEMREDRGEIEWGLADKKATIELVELEHIRGDLHSHTVASDGGRTIEEMVAEAKRRGYEYLAITDHSKSSFQANGLKVDRLLEHIKAIHAVAKQAAKSGMLVLAGAEVDILADGSLDYEDDILAKLDWVIGSPHAALTQESEAATARLVRACANPYVCLVGHPTGRIVPSRRGLEPDMPKVIFAAARNGSALEVNANYHRLDLRDTHVRLAVDAKVPICINTDAHSFEDFDQMIYGVLTARRGWAKKADILNTRPAAALKKWLAERKAQALWE